MGRFTKEKARKLYDATVRLVRYTTWKCGRVERAIINFLWNRRIRFGSRSARVREVIQAVPSRHEALDALRRLQNRRIIRIDRVNAGS